MKAKTIGIQRDVTFMVSLIGAAGLLAASVVPVSSAEPLFGQTNLVSDIPGLAQITDSSLVNAWGISEKSRQPHGSRFPILDLRQRYGRFDAL